MLDQKRFWSEGTIQKRWYDTMLPAIRTRFARDLSDAELTELRDIWLFGMAVGASVVLDNLDWAMNANRDDIDPERN